MQRANFGRLRKPQKVGNTSQILLKMVLFDTESTEGFVEVKTSKSQHLLAGKNGQFWPIFMAELRKPRKITNTYQILLKKVLFDAEFIERFVKSKTSKNQRL